VSALKAQAGRSARWTAMPLTALLTGVSIATHSAPEAVATAALLALAALAGWSW
jgi:hypothetical protein